MRLRLPLAPYLIIFFFGLISLNSCKNALEEERGYAEIKKIESYIASKGWICTNNGSVYIRVGAPSYGYQVSNGDTITFWYKGYTLNGEVFETNIISEAREANLDTTIRSFEPLVTIAGRGNLVEGLGIGMLLLHEGEFATILFPSSLGFGKNCIGSISQYSPLAYDIELIKVNGVGIQEETAFIDGLNLIGSGFTKDTSGLFYKFLPLGFDSTPTINDTIYGWYKGTTLPDETIISDLGEGSQQIILSDSDIPDGVRLGFLLTKIGGSTDLVIPSFLGFGNEGIGVVGPYQTLSYKIRLDSIK